MLRLGLQAGQFGHDPPSDHLTRVRIQGLASARQGVVLAMLSRDVSLLLQNAAHKTPDTNLQRLSQGYNSLSQRVHSQSLSRTLSM